jgi:predicted secreted protein
MSIVSFVAIYFVIWWVVLFAVLPFGVRNSHESDQIAEAGHDAGAPHNALIFQKFFATTAISAALFLGLWWFIDSGMIGLDDIPFLNAAPPVK